MPKLEVTSIALVAGHLQITLANQTLIDGDMYFINLSQTFPTGLMGTEPVDFIINGVTVYASDRRAKMILTDRVKHNERIAMIYTEGSIAGSVTSTQVGAFVFLKGVVPA